MENLPQVYQPSNEPSNQRGLVGLNPVVQKQLMVMDFLLSAFSNN